MNIPEGWTTATVSVNGVDLQYYRTGDGPPLVMAHGFFDNGRCWAPLAEDFADDYDVIMYDARGHGLSDAPETGYDIESRVADLVGIITELDLNDPILLGHSMGGATAASTAAKHPTLLRAVVLEDPAGMYGEPERDPDERAQIVMKRLNDRADRSVEDVMREYDNDLDSEWTRRLVVADTECRPAIAEIAREGYPILKDTFGKISCPTLVLKADGDTEQRVDDREVADELTNGRLVHVPDAGHCVFRDEYDAAYAELRTFLQRV